MLQVGDPARRDSNHDDHGVANDDFGKKTPLRKRRKVTVAT